MKILEDLFSSDRGESAFPESGLNPFRDPDLLVGAQILEVRYDGIQSVLAVLLEMRLAEYGWTGSAGLIVVSDVTDFSWSQDSRGGKRTAWTILRSMPKVDSDVLTFDLVGSPAFSLVFTARTGYFYTGRIDGLEESAPPDYSEGGIAEIRNSIPYWGSSVSGVEVARFP